MGWKHKHFTGVRTYRQPVSQVLAEALALMSEAPRWAIEENTADGFSTRTNTKDFGHDATATFQVVPDGDGARLTIEMAVRRFGLEGYMLFDIGGYYDGEIRHWLEGINDRLDGQAGAAAYRLRGTGKRMYGCLTSFIVVGLGLSLGWNFIIGPIIGLTTGVYYVVGGRHGGDELHGAWARGVSAGILALDGLVFFYLRRWYRRSAALRAPDRSG